MANVFLQIPVPTTPGVGAAIDVSGIGPEKSIVLSGPGGALPAESGAEGTVVLEVSQDGSHFAPYKLIDLVADPRIPSFVVVCSHVRVRRTIGFGGNVTLALGGESTSSNLFGTILVPGSGVGVPLDTSALGVRKTVVVSGQYVGNLIIEGSVDGGTKFDPIITCSTQNSASYVIQGIWQYMRVTRVGGVGGSPIATVGGHPIGGAGGVNSCILKWGGDHESYEESPDPLIWYFADTFSDFGPIEWNYAMPVAGTLSGFRVNSIVNTMVGPTAFEILKNGIATSQAVTVASATVGIFITSGASVSLAVNDEIALRATTTPNRGVSSLYFTAMASLAIS
jgi:hypothetical protein